MTFTSMIKTFAADESGAVTVDWVVLTAAIVGLGLAVITSVRSGVGALGTDISNSLSSASVATLGTLGVNQ
jgi:Flp pilus assembly pilin Flp